MLGSWQLILRLILNVSQGILRLDFAIYLHTQDACLNAAGQLRIHPLAGIIVIKFIVLGKINKKPADNLPAGYSILKSHKRLTCFATLAFRKCCAKNIAKAGTAVG